ncbi:MAG TPA: Uma2 family endonuclease [Thermoanaerobaculia bacterium]|jgi:Uma2 family endonuclease|nr:Uma2 family endonuclease [Thermoanaerobaculia bacterium]
MSQPALAALDPLPFELVTDDGEPLESNWHVDQITLLKESIKQLMKGRGRGDYFVGGNMFVYYSIEQARQVKVDVDAGINDRRHYRGPDVFYVGGVERRKREFWVVWEEGYRYPEVIVELLSPSTAKIDRTVKKDLYAGTFRTPEYFYYDPDKVKLDGFRLAGQSYRPIVPNAQGRLVSERLGVELGLWQGVYQENPDTWVRLFHPDGRLVPSADERAAAAEARADAERQRAEAAEAELARLRARLGEGS